MNYLEPLIGRECTRITFEANDPRLVLWFLYEGPVARIEISGRLTLHIDGTTSDLDPVADLVGCGALISLVGRRVTSAEVGDDESLSLAFAGGARLQVPGDSHLEPWWFDVVDGTGAA